MMHTGASVDDLLNLMRRERQSHIASISLLMELTGMTLRDARRRYTRVLSGRMCEATLRPSTSNWSKRPNSSKRISLIKTSAVGARTGERPNRPGHVLLHGRDRLRADDYRCGGSGRAATRLPALRRG